MANKVIEGVQLDALLNQEQRQQFGKRLLSVVWKIKKDVSSSKKDGGSADEDRTHVAGVCVSPAGYILSSAHVIKPGAKYVGSCPSWKAGWTALKVVKSSIMYGLCLFKLEGRKKVDYTSLAQSGILNVNQHVYAFGHPDLFGMSCADTFVRGSVEYPCEDIAELPTCLNDMDKLLNEFEDIDKNASASKLAPKFDITKAQIASPRMVKHLTAVLDKVFEPKTILLMHEDIPLIQIRNFHLGRCGAPVFVPSGHIVGINLFEFEGLNFAAHLSAIKEFLKDVDLSK